MRIGLNGGSEGYAKGESEAVMGQAIKELGWAREEFVISTKIYFGTGGTHPNATGLSRKHVREAFAASLKRLQMPYVDIVFCHRPDGTTPMEEVVRTMTQFIQEGRAFYWGTSEWSAFEIEHAHHVATRFGLIPPIVEQPQYSLLKRERFEAEYEPLYQLYRYGTTIWSPLKMGVLTGKYNDGVPKGSRFETSWKDGAKELSTEEGKATIEKVRKFCDLAARLGVSAATVALAWCLTNKNVSTVILGASRPQQITDNLKALDVLPRLTPDVLEEIEEIFDNKPTVKTYRY